MGFEMQFQHPHVEILSLHLPDHQQVLISEGKGIDEMKEAMEALATTPPETSLTAYFKVNQEFRDAKATALALDLPFPPAGVIDVSKILYHDLVKFFTLSSKKSANTCSWLRRQSGSDYVHRRLEELHPRHEGERIGEYKKRLKCLPEWISTDDVGRMRMAHFSNPEEMCLRTLLVNVSGSTSFEDLKTIDGIQHETFKSAAQASGLVEDESEYEECMAEIALVYPARQVREMYVQIIVFCSFSRPKMLFEKHHHELLDDFLHEVKSQREAGTTVTEQLLNQEQAVAETRLMCELTIMLQKYEKTLKEYGLPEPDAEIVDSLGFYFAKNPLVQFELSLGRTKQMRTQLLADTRQNERLMYPEQRALYEELKTAINAQQGGVFFIDAPGGTGKSFLTKTLLMHCRGLSRVAIACASSGIAATVYPLGHTVNAALKVPLGADPDSYCNISQLSRQAELLEKAWVIIWDEVINIICKNIFYI